MSWILVGQWQEYSLDTNLRVGNPVAVGSLTLPTEPLLTSPVQYVVVQMDQHGYIVSVGQNTANDMSLVHGTCWNSFRAGPV